jgi:DNA-binding XRE family transcriptional regulator/uncharacterized protein YxeA
MTYLEYAETTVPGLIEFIFIICILFAFVFVSVNNFLSDNSAYYWYLGGFGLVITLILIVNMITFQIVNRDIRVYPGISLVLILLTNIFAMVLGSRLSKTPKLMAQTNSFEGRKEQIPISEILRDKREEADYTQQELADAILVSRQTVHRWESGKSHPDLEIMIRVAQALDFPVSEFWDDNSEQMNEELVGNLHRGKVYKQTLYFILSLIAVAAVLVSVAYFGKNAHSQYLDRINPFLKEEVGYVLVQKQGRQKAAVIDNDFGDGSIITINGSYSGKDEFVKVVHKGSYLKTEIRNVPKRQVPTVIVSHLYYITHFNSPETGLQKLQISYHKRDI